MQAKQSPNNSATTLPKIVFTHNPAVRIIPDTTTFKDHVCSNEDFEAVFLTSQLCNRPLTTSFDMIDRNEYVISEYVFEKHILPAFTNTINAAAEADEGDIVFTEATLNTPTVYVGNMQWFLESGIQPTYVDNYGNKFFLITKNITLDIEGEERRFIQHADKNDNDSCEENQKESRSKIDMDVIGGFVVHESTDPSNPLPIVKRIIATDFGAPMFDITVDNNDMITIPMIHGYTPQAIREKYTTYASYTDVNTILSVAELSKIERAVTQINDRNSNKHTIAYAALCIMGIAAKFNLHWNEEYVLQFRTPKSLVHALNTATIPLTPYDMKRIKFSFETIVSGTITDKAHPLYQTDPYHNVKEDINDIREIALAHRIDIPFFQIPKFKHANALIAAIREITTEHFKPNPAEIPTDCKFLTLRAPAPAPFTRQPRK